MEEVTWENFSCCAIRSRCLQNMAQQENPQLRSIIVLIDEGLADEGSLFLLYFSKNVQCLTERSLTHCGSTGQVPTQNVHSKDEEILTDWCNHNELVHEFYIVWRLSLCTNLITSEDSVRFQLKVLYGNVRRVHR